MAAKSASQDRSLRAVALSYEERDAIAGLSPRVVASGQGTIAEQIIARAAEFGVPVHESRELVAALMDFDLDQRIPPALYVAVAEVLVWVHRLEHGAAPLPLIAAE
ncbi:MAG TPA: EscU/YscU/HrcU family type III secretion system export apparatus switch protein [Burkholderiaceae bacterium]|nr:EscU/YscU/HrcU family type III secretion system export apparatus switch protein [Burkholderiaceae bacterium]